MKTALTPLLSTLTATLLALAGNHCLAQTTAPAPTAPITVDVVASHGSLTAGLPDADALNVRGTWLLSGGDVARAELLRENKFGSQGGIVAVGYTKVLSPDWTVAGTLALGRGGANWARDRVDLELSRAWTEQRSLVTRVAVYRATFDGNRSDRGLRLGLAAYLPGTVVLEGGTALNISAPGAVHSSMPFVSATWGSDGQQYLSVRASSGTEAYQSIGAGQQLVGFKSRSLGLNWRRWMAPQWGFSAQAEQYHNPSYERSTLGVGLFAQW